MRVHTNAQLACHRLTLPRKEVKTERGREREGREKERERFLWHVTLAVYPCPPVCDFKESQQRVCETDIGTQRGMVCYEARAIFLELKLQPGGGWGGEKQCPFCPNKPHQDS